MLRKQDEMLKKQDQILKKQDETINTIKELELKVDRVGEKIDALRQDLKLYLDERFRKIEMEIERIKEEIGLK